MKITYPDKWLRLISYPLLGFVVRHFGEYESIGSLMKKPLYYGDLAWNTLLVALSWEANRKFIQYLDAHYSWVDQRFQRLFIQVFGSLLFTVPLVAGMIYIWNELIIHRPNNFDTSYLLVYDFPLTLLFTLLVHLIYTGLYFQQYYSGLIRELQNRVRELETSVAGVKNASELNKESGYREILIVNYGSSSVPVPTGTIAYVYKQNEVSFIRTLEGKEYTSSASLEQLEALLDPANFFRLNRQMIAHLNSIRQFRSDSAGKLSIELTPVFSEEVSVSKKKAGEFKDWIGKKV